MRYSVPNLCGLPLFSDLDLPTSGGGTSHTEGNESDEQSRSSPPSKRMRGTAVFFVKKTGKYSLGPPIPSGDSHMHAACGVAAIYAWHRAG